jgi:hypothetical protein
MARGSPATGSRNSQHSCIRATSGDALCRSRQHGGGAPPLTDDQQLRLTRRRESDPRWATIRRTPDRAPGTVIQMQAPPLRRQTPSPERRQLSGSQHHALSLNDNTHSSKKGKTPPWFAGHAPRPIELTALRPRTIVPVVHPGMPKLRLAHHPVARMRASHVRQIPLIVGNAENCAHHRRCPRKYVRDVVDHLLVVRAGR